MKKFFLFLAMIVMLGTIGISSFTEARSYRTKVSDVHVGGYYRKSGTYVKPYYRSKADGIKSNNYSCIDYGRCR